MTPRERLRANIRRKARRVLRTYVGQHWPDARTMNYNGIGIDFGESGSLILDALSDSPEKTT